MAPQLTARNATPQDLVKILNEQKAHKLDVVVPATNMKMKDGLLIVKDSEAVLGEDGVTTTNGIYRPTDVFDDGLSDKLAIPRQYLRRLRGSRPDMLDQNVNGWLHGRKRVTGSSYPETSKFEVVYPADGRAFLLRLFRGDEGGEGVARAMLSNKYALSMDNLDMLTAVMSGIRDSGYQPLVRVSNLSERGMRVRFEFPDLHTQAPGLLDGYRSPFDGGGAVRRAGSFDELRQQYGAHHMFSEKDAPLAYVGIDFTNSETGDGKYKLTPVIGIVRCTNGLIDTRNSLARTHLGARLDEGIVKPSAETIRKAGELVVAQTTDAVNAWLAPEYLERTIAGWTEQAQVPVTASAETVPAVVADLGFSQEEQQGVLDLFIRSGQVTAGGIANAVSAYAQTVEDVDRAYEIELKAVEAMERAAARS